MDLGRLRVLVFVGVCARREEPNLEIEGIGDLAEVVEVAMDPFEACGRSLRVWEATELMEK